MIGPELDRFRLDRWSPVGNESTGDLARMACWLEATAPKVGNVHPDASFVDMSYDDFVWSAELLGSAIDDSVSKPVGQSILNAVTVTKMNLGINTNLGMVLLIVPLAKALDSIRHARDRASDHLSFTRRWQTNLSSILQSLTERDAVDVYSAICLAQPGGLGEVDEMDVRSSTPCSLSDAMQIAKDRDDIAKQYVSDFQDCFDLAEGLIQYRTSGLGWLESICRIHLVRLSIAGDTLIRRKNGSLVDEQLRPMADRCVKAFDQPGEYARCVAELDEFLRLDGHRRNPGTTADLIAAAIFIAIA